MTLSITDFLKDKQTVLTSVFGHYCTMFKIKNNLNIDQKLYTSFDNRLKPQSLSFVLNLDSKEFTQVNVKDENGALSTTLTDEDKAFILEVLEIYLARVNQDITRITKQMRSDWGRNFKTEIIECSGFREYFSRVDNEVSRGTGANIVSYTLSTMTKKRAAPFANY